MLSAENVLIAEKIVVAILLFAGFLWIRSRARSHPAGSQATRATLGIYMFLPALLIGEKLLFDKWHFGPWPDLLIKALVLPATFLAVGLLFLRKGAPAEETAG